MTGFEEAKELLRDNLPSALSQVLPLSETLDCFVAGDLAALIDVPSFDNSAMDGYAFRYDAGTDTFKKDGEIKTGHQPSEPVRPGTCSRIFTGAMLPPGADTVIPFEKVQEAENEIRFDTALISKGANVRVRGSQHRKGDAILRKGQVILPGAIALLASNGYAKVEVFRPPAVAVIVTGDELVPVGHDLHPGQIYNSNAPALQACLQQSGIRNFRIFHSGDAEGPMKELMQFVLENYDVLLLTGGISAGDYDFVKKILPALGVRQLFYKVRQKPGKPIFGGLWKDKVVFALPGNPASVLSCYYQFVAPALRYMCGDPFAFAPSCRQVLLNDWTKKDSLSHVLKARSGSEGVYILPGQESFNLSAFAEANAFVVMPEMQMQWRAGEIVDVYLM